jgi:hypothetical protein
MFQGCTDRQLNVGNNPHQQSASDKVPRNGKIVVIRKVDGQRFLPHIEKPQSCAIYITVTKDDIKIQEGELLALHMTGVRQQQVPSHPLKKQ